MKRIQVLSVTVETKTTSTGKAYQLAEVAYKNLSTSKVESKKITSYSKAFNVLAGATGGQIFDVLDEKNDKTGYWDWNDATRVLEDQQLAAPPAAAARREQTTTRSTYETPEERAQKQVYIVKQSSISNAITVLCTGAKTPPSEDQILTLAQKFTDWVFSSPKLSLEATPNDIVVDVQ